MADIAAAGWWNRTRLPPKESVVTNTRALIASAAAAVLGGVLAVGAPAVASAAPRHTSTVYTLSNAAAGNDVLAFTDAGGVLTPAGSYPTGGAGTDAGLGSQGALTLADHQQVLLAVNAGSNSVTALRVGSGGGLTVRSTVPSGGRQPVSVTVHGDLVYVLNAGDDTISGFRLVHGRLVPLPGSTRALSAGAGGAAQVGFSPDGRRLVVTEKASNSLDTFTVDRSGRASAARATASVGAVPFGFDFDERGDAVVSDAAVSAVTSYRLGSGVATVAGYVPDGQGAACWLVVSRHTGTAYVANAATGTISTYDVRGGGLSLTDAVAATVGGHPTDEALGRDGDLYVRDATGSRVQAVRFDSHSGAATVVNGPAGLPSGAAGLAVVTGE
jgi:6-phosphogluconolactonase (cycloisomerase 2 family)